MTTSMAKFEVGKSYTHTVLVRDSNGNKSTRTEIYTITKRTPCYVTFYHIAWSGSKMPHGRCKILTAEPFGEYIHLGVLSGYLYAENIVNDDSQPEAAEMPATAEITQATDNDNAMASQPAIVASTQSETTAQNDLPDPVQSETNAQHEIVKFEVGKTYQNDSPDFCYGAYYTITGKSRQFVSFESYFLRKQAYKKLRIGTDRNGVLCEYFDDKEKGSPYPAQMVYATALAPDIPNNTDSPASVETVQTESAPAIIYGMSDVEKSLRRIKSKSSRKKSQHTPAENAQPDNLYDDGSFSDAPGDNSCPDMDIPECREPDSIPANNPGFTVVHSEHITRPDYTVYPDAIHDDIPCVNVPACVTQTLSSDAVVPYADAATIRKIFRIIAIYLRFWFESHLHQHHEPIPSHVFAPWFIELADYAPGNPNDISTLQYKWQRKKFSEKLKLCRSQIASCKTREEIIACLQNISSESIRLLCVADRVLGKFARISANSECERKLAYAQIYADKIIQRREKAMTISAETRDITAVKKKKKYTVNPSPRIEVRPEKAQDIEHKLIDTTNLHFQERRDALDHNAAVISSCMFHEAIVSMLLKISPAAIFQLGMHMGLFIAKPKGKKIVIAEAFAKRLIERRDLHAAKSASVHTSNTHQTSKNTAGVPDNVKFFETKHGQLAFIFTD